MSYTAEDPALRPEGESRETAGGEVVRAAPAGNDVPPDGAEGDPAEPSPAPGPGGPERSGESDESGESGESGESSESGKSSEIDDIRRKAAERDEYLDILKRTKADFANYRKRVDGERARWGLIAQRELVTRLLSATDQCRLAAQRSKDDESAESLRGCIALIWSEMERFLDSSGVVQVPTEGESFDPEKHQAVFVQERDDLPDGTIVDEVRAGYRLGEQVLRPAQVVVAKRPKPPEPAVAEEPGAGAEGDGAADEGAPPPLEGGGWGEG